MSRPRLHGTDGIRGRVCEADGSDEIAIEKLISQRELSPRVMRLIGEAVGMDVDGGKVVIGWDRRPGNADLVGALTHGLLAAGCDVQHVGEVPTPGLHHCLLDTGAAAGLMVTASHNPAEDSGVKLFDAGGYKSMPAWEDEISARIWALADGSLACPDGDGQLLDAIDGLSSYRAHLKRRLHHFEDLFGVRFEGANWGGIIPATGMLLDCSGGAGTTWLAAGLARRGITAEEVSDVDHPINDHCGAGELSPTDAWTHAELLEDPPDHMLLLMLAEVLEICDGMAPWSHGELVAAALDGDGDRCLLIEATEDGVRVVDGDRMAHLILAAATSGDATPWQFATSIESDLDLTAGVARYPAPVHHRTTAVGDRWLADHLRHHSGPHVLGAEDSGHLVMTSPYEGRTALVGDGAASLLAVLCARLALIEAPDVAPYYGGWKRRVSISPSDRSRWDGKNALAKSVQAIVEDWAGEHLSPTPVDGEASLLLLEGEGWSVAVRNSGTQAKTAVSLRLAAPREDADDLLKSLISLLEPALSLQ